MLVGYARTSTTDQIAGLEAQLAELKAAGVERCYSEHASALSPDRRQWDACRTWLREGDTLVVTKPDRLARSVVDLLTIEAELRDRGVGLRVLSLNLDTSTATGRLTLSLLGAVSEWERAMMLERQRSGIEAAKLAGKYRGRAPTARAQSAEILALAGKGVDRTEIAKLLKLSRSSVYRVLKAERDAAEVSPAP